MRIEVISCWHNEQDLAPFFLRHYDFAYSIKIVMGKDTTDLSRSICKDFKNVEIIEINFPDGLLDDGFKVSVLNSLSLNSKADWLISVDADEFIFCIPFEPISSFLKRQSYDYVKVCFWNVFRHVTESDFDPSQPPLFQRRHGPLAFRFIKPIVVRPGLKWLPGQEALEPSLKAKECQEVLFGAHWAYADYIIACRRYLAGRRDRFSLENKKNLWGHEHFNETEESILRLCESHANDELLF